MITIDQRFIYLQNSYNEYKWLFDNGRINKVEYELYIDEIEEQAVLNWGSSKALYDFINSQNRVEMADCT